MKTILFFTLGIWCTIGFSQSYSDKQEFQVKTQNLKEFHLYNRNGNVKVRGVDGNVARIFVTRSLKSTSSKTLEVAKTELRLDSMFIDGAIYFYVRSEEHTFEIDEDGRGRYNSCCSWESRNSKIRVSYEFEILLEIPRTMILYVITHRKDLEIEDFDGKLYAQNHHGNLIAKRLGGNVTLANHHGNITVTFTKNPSANCSYRTHHGDISIGFQQDLSAIASFQSKHGSFYTDFDWSPQPISYVKGASKKGTKYKVGGSTSVKIKKGGPSHDFKTWHGDVYVNKI